MVDPIEKWEGIEHYAAPAEGVELAKNQRLDTAREEVRRTDRGGQGYGRS